MKKANWILREIFYRIYDKNESFMSQKSIAQACGVSMDTVNRLVAKLNQFRAIEKKPLGFRVAEPEKALAYWASTRNLVNDIVYSTYSPDSVSEIEADMPSDTIFTAFSGYKLKFKSTPIHYEEVHVYAGLDEVQRRFPKTTAEQKNVFVLRSDPHLKKTSEDGSPPLAQLYVDLWQIGGATTNRFILELEKRLEAKPTEALKALARPKNWPSAAEAKIIRRGPK
jgi:DNA-binding transcriptional regulator YhcF (GntR family)